MSLVLILSIALLGPAAARQVVEEGPLASYVAAPDSSYRWVKFNEGRISESTEYVELILTSQTWKDIPWKHQLFIIKPSTMKADSRHAMLVISGGRWKDYYEDPAQGGKLPKRAKLFGALAEEMGTPVAVLRQVPHQPVFNGLKEDQIIAYTFDKYLDTQQADWPLLLPMVKSAVRAMDATEEFAASAWDMELETFTVTGASKRGWTTWLTASVDQRITAMAPIVIDMLNLGPHLAHQQAVWGGFSEQIADYDNLDIFERLQSTHGRALRYIVDPYQYREVLTPPKLIIIGTNDRYWPVDSLNLYWDELPGSRYALYVPNNRHGIKDYGRVLGSLNALHQHANGVRSLPELHWNFEENDDAVNLVASSSQTTEKMVAWVATSETRDFREALWTPQAIQVGDDGTGRFELARPETGYAALFGEFVYAHPTLPYYFSTNLRVVEGQDIRERAGQTQASVNLD
jgi:PhoPQ-activated pathogenicity-related protein